MGREFHSAFRRRSNGVESAAPSPRLWLVAPSIGCTRETLYGSNVPEGRVPMKTGKGWQAQ